MDKITLETTVTLSEMSLLLNLSDARVNALAKQGILIKDGKNSYRLVDSIRNYIEFLKDETGDLSLQEERAKLVHHQAEIAKLELQKLKKMLIDKEEVEMEAAQCAKRVRDAISLIPDRLFNRDVIDRNVYQILVNEITDTLERL
jgi:phage terminase Nu1 subunit (DNA packaging protein)